MNNGGRRFGTPHIGIIASMLVFGTVGVVRRFVLFPSGFTAMLRGFIGALVIGLFMLVTRKRLNLPAIKANAVRLILSGVFIGVNWILLFEAFNYTTIAVATVCYYLAPIFVIIISPIALGERIGAVRGSAVVLALVGAVVVSEPWADGFVGGKYLIGVLLAVGAAVFYAGVTVLNKKMRDIPSLDMTLVQLAVAATVVLPYTLIAEPIEPKMFEITTVLLVLLLGAVHTGGAYLFYFSAVNRLPAATSAIFSYIDPLFAVILSALVLREPFTVFSALGALIILGATLISELFGDLRKKKG